jgi:hypothetical protein
VSAAVHQVVESTSGAHSKKPIEVQERIVKLMGDVPRIELFARETAPGWDAWGNDLRVVNMDGEPVTAGSRIALETSDAPSPGTQAPNREPGYDLFAAELERNDTVPGPGRYTPGDSHRRGQALDYVQAHGRVTRGELAKFCGITPEEASVVLRMLVDEKCLRMHGQKRWSWYEPLSHP